MEEKTKKKVSGKIISFVIIVLLLVYLAVQFSNFLSKDVKISGLREYSIEDVIDAQMLIYKDESVISSNTSGGCDYAVADGQKVSAGEKVAIIYQNMNSPELLNTVKNLELQIESYSDILESESSFDYDIAKLDDSIDKSISAILYQNDTGNVNDSQSEMTELKKLLHKRGLINGDSVNSAARVSELQSQLDAIISQNYGAISSIYSSSSGFFVSSYDGLEGTIPTASSENITVSSFEKYLSMDKKDEAPSGYVGSVITGFSWLGSFEVASDYNINEGDYVKIRVPDYSNEAFYVLVDYVSQAESGKKVVTVTSSDNIDILSKSRFQQVELIDKVYTGLRVTKDAIKTVDSKTGVFVIKGKILDFQEVEIIYSGEDFVIIKAAEDSVLYDNDDIVISGKNLYDGKVVTSSTR